MELRLWNFEEDSDFIPSFLSGMSLAHHSPIKTKEWFRWKFEQSPYGQAILACAFDGETVVGCVAYGRGIVKYQGKIWTSGLSYETFVHPAYQGKGLFKKLISLAEKEMAVQGIQFLYNFPNSNSITGFKHMNWNCRNDVRCFKIKPFHLLKILLNAKDLKESFCPNPSNINSIKNVLLDDIGYLNTNADIITPIWSKEYLRWRFFTFPNREYLVLNNTDYFSISMVGKRGTLNVVHLLYAFPKTGSYLSEVMPRVINDIKKQSHADFMEYSSTIFDDSLTKCYGFFKVPAHGNFCYKTLDDTMTIKNFKIVLPSINAHTY